MSIKHDEIVLTVKYLSKVFSRVEEPISMTLADKSDFYVLKNISFNLYKGEMLGLIGRNGAGKSTLLKILSEIITQTSGTIEYTGKLASILELGSGFHPDLSGRENVFMALSLQGISKIDAKKIYNDIVNFSGLNDFIEMPLKHFSGGMYLRLAFSIVFHSTNDILLLDEVLAVGDADFKVKCYTKIRELSKAGVAIILTNHNLELIQDFCKRTMLLENGEISKIGETTEVIEYYIEGVNSNKDHKIGQKTIGLVEGQNINYLFQSFLNIEIGGHIQISKFAITAENAKSPDLIYISEAIEISMELNKITNIEAVEITYTLRNQNGQMLLVDSFGLRKKYVPVIKSKGKYHVLCTIPGDLLNRGIYSLGLNVSVNYQLVEEMNEIARFKVHPNKEISADNTITSLIRPKLNWIINKLN